VIWLAAQPWRGGERRVAQVGGALAALLLLVARLPAYRGLDVQLRDYLSVSEHLAPRSTLLPISFASRGMGPDGRVLSIRVEPLLHAAARLAVERDVVNLGNYEAASTVFPVRFRPEIDPYRHLGPPRGLMRKPPQVEITGYDERTPGRIDYVLVWGPADDPGAAPARAELEAQLRPGWEPIFVSPRGWTRLYRRF
jgi:hypothetical protein